MTLLPVVALLVLISILAFQIRSLQNSSTWVNRTDVVVAKANILPSATLGILALVALLAACGVGLFVQQLHKSREMYRRLAKQYSEAVRAARESEARYRTLFDSIDEAFCIVEVIFDQTGKAVDYRFLETNPSFEKHTGLVNTQGRTMREFVPAHEQHWFDTYGRIALTGEPARFQNLAEELHRWFDVYAFRFGKPEQHRVAVLFNDITARITVEEALRRSSERFRAIYERAPIGIEQVALDGRLLMVNAAQCTMLGYTESELLTKTFEDITHPSDRGAENAMLKRLLSGEQDSYTLEKRYVHKNGNPVWVNIVSTVVRNLSGAPEYRITVVEDITTRKRAEQALINAEKLTVAGRMASSMAHEINNPLGAALNSLYLVSLDSTLSKSSCQYLEAAQRELERVAHLAKQTLGFYRETGNPTKVDLRQVADDVVNMYTPKLINKNIQLERRYWTEAPVFGIEGELRQIMSNLVINSIDASGANGCIRVRIAGPSKLDGDRPLVRLSVRDNGSGIKPQHLKQIFEPFFSTKETTGTGLGLWVTLQLVKKHGGTIKVRSRAGAGTIVQVYLPVERRTLERLTQDHEGQGINAAV